MIQAKTLKVFTITGILLFTGLANCRPGVHTSPEILSLKARNLGGQDLELKSIQSRGIVLNFYSPTCVPCIEELPALHILQQQAEALGIQMYLAVTPDLESNGVDPLKASSKPGFEEVYPLLRERLEQDIRQYGIEVPIIVLKPPFEIKEKGPVTGTPETVFLMTSPLRLHYNLVGPISLGQNQEEVLSSSRFQFALELLTHLTAASGSAREDESGSYY
ncbi:MAG: redoxin domain-containing protein [Leptospiraceae bacterium]|nr:redoxin domain-containing protein [Leptospiraceae bacterium]